MLYEKSRRTRIHAEQEERGSPICLEQLIRTSHSTTSGLLRSPPVENNAGARKRAAVLAPQRLYRVTTRDARDVVCIDGVHHTCALTHTHTHTHACARVDVDGDEDAPCAR